jgi:hypothetical protein
MSAPLILKHDVTSTDHPASSQLVVGELVINSKTGKLYTKLVNGAIFEFTGQQVCFSKTPAISFDDFTNFCCVGDILKVKVVDLIAANNYNFELEDISGNNIDYTINSPIYTSYQTTLSDSTVINLKEAIIPISLSINGDKNLTILKFKILGKDNDINLELTSRTLTLSCQNC